IERVVMDAHGGKIGGEELDIHLAGSGESIRAEGGNRVGVWRIAVERVHVRRGAVNNARIRRAWRGDAERRGHRQPRIVYNIRRNCDLFLVVVQAVTTADHEFVVELARTPGKADLGPEIILLRVPGI